MICAQGQRVLRSGKEKFHWGRCWGKVFSVNELGEGSFCAFGTTINYVKVTRQLVASRKVRRAIPVQGE